MAEPEFTLEQLAGFAEDEAAMRRRMYPVWGKCTLDQLAPSQKRKIAAMEQIARDYREAAAAIASDTL